MTTIVLINFMLICMAILLQSMTNNNLMIRIFIIRNHCILHSNDIELICDTNIINLNPIANTTDSDIN